MKITDISLQVRDKNRVNIFIDGKYRFSLDVSQVVDLGVKVGKEYDDEGLRSLELEGQFGKLYQKALNYCFVRPRSENEVKIYVMKKIRAIIDKKDDIDKSQMSLLSERVIDRLKSKSYVDDYNFAKFWVENRSLKKGVSQRKLALELSQKNVDRSVIDRVLSESQRNDKDELTKIIEKKRSRYDDERKFMNYLSGLGFSYDDIKQALKDD